MIRARAILIALLTAVMAIAMTTPANAATHGRVTVHKTSHISIGIQLGADGKYGIQQVPIGYQTRYSGIKYSIDGMGSLKQNCYVLQHLRGSTWFEELGQPDGKGYRALPGPATNNLLIRAVKKPASYCR